MTGETPRALPLEGITVLDLGQIYQGPYAGFLLAMSGARVIKVENLRGDTLRALGDSLPYAMINSAKEAITLNLKAPRGRELFLHLAAAADAVLCNFAPGVPERLGIDAPSLWKVNPRLVFAQASGYGLDGPDADRTAMDITVQAHMGAMAITGYPDQPPVKSGAAFVDFLGGSHLYGAVVTALFDAQRTGVGRMVSTSMSEAAYFTLTTALQAWRKTGAAPRTANRNAAMSVAPQNVYPCSDGYVAVISTTNRHWRVILEVIGRDDLISDERYRHNADRAARMDDVDALMSEWTSGRTRADAAMTLAAAGVPVQQCSSGRAETPDALRLIALRSWQFAMVGEVQHQQLVPAAAVVRGELAPELCGHGTELLEFAPERRLHSERLTGAGKADRQHRSARVGHVVDAQLRGQRFDRLVVEPLPRFVEPDSHR